MEKKTLIFDLNLVIERVSKNVEVWPTQSLLEFKAQLAQSENVLSNLDQSQLRLKYKTCQRRSEHELLTDTDLNKMFAIAKKDSVQIFITNARDD